MPYPYAMKQLLISLIPLVIFLGCTPTSYQEGVGRTSIATPEPESDLVQIEIGDHQLQFHVLRPAEIISKYPVEEYEYSSVCTVISGCPLDLITHRYMVDFGHHDSTNPYIASQVYISAYDNEQSLDVVDWIELYRKAYASDNSSEYTFLESGNSKALAFEDFSVNSTSAGTTFTRRKFIVSDFDDFIVEINLSTRIHDGVPGLGNPATTLKDHMEQFIGFNTILDTIRVAEQHTE